MMLGMSRKRTLTDYAQVLPCCGQGIITSEVTSTPEEQFASGRRGRPQLAYS